MKKKVWLLVEFERNQGYQLPIAVFDSKSLAKKALENYAGSLDPELVEFELNSIKKEG